MNYFRLFLICWIILCAACMMVAWEFKPAFSYDPVGPRAYPLLLLFLMVVAALWLAIQPTRFNHQVSYAVSKKIISRACLCIVFLFAYAATFEWLGFIISTLITIFLMGLLFGGKCLGSAITAVIMSISLFGLFDYALDVSLPLGIVSKLLGA